MNPFALQNQNQYGQVNPQMNMNAQMNPQMMPQMGDFYQTQLKQYHKTLLERNIQVIYEWNIQPQLSSAVQILQTTLNQMKEEVNECTDQQGVNKQNEQSARQIQESCAKIKGKNQELLTRVLNMKERITRLMYMHRQKNPEREFEFNLVQDKIKRLKIDIGTRINSIKLNMEKKGKAKELGQVAQSQPFKIVLTELKDGTEILQMETIKARDEMRTLRKYLTDDLRI